MILHELNFRAPVEVEVEPPRRVDVTMESVYSSSGINTPPVSPKAPPDPSLLRLLETTTLPLKSPQQLPPSTSSPQTPTQTPTSSLRVQQRQGDVRDRLSEIPVAKAGALKEMYREREHQATGGASGASVGVGGGSPGKISSSPLKSTQAKGQAAKESTALPTPPDKPQSNELEFENEPLVVNVEDSELMEPPSLDLDPQGRSSS